MTAPQHRLIQQAVVQWHNRHPLAARIDTSQVHSMGWVALPFMRPAQGIEPSLDAPRAAEKPAPLASHSLRDRLLRMLPGKKRAAGQSWPVFSETFIEGVKPRLAAAFALQFGEAAPSASAEANADWPQRRIEVDSALAERAAGAWPTELWVVSAAVEHGGRRVRVLISADGRAVAGPRLWHTRRLQGLALLVGLAVLGGAAWQLQQSREDVIPPPATRASGMVMGSVVAASGAGASAPAAASAASDGASGSAGGSASAPASAATGPASATASEATASAPAEALATPVPSASAPLIDIRPRLGPSGTPRARPAPPPAVASAAAQAGAGAAASAPSTPSKPRPESETAQRTRPGKEAKEAKPGRGAATPENIAPGQAAGGPVVALVSPGLLTKVDADMMRERMLVHLGQTMGKTSGLQSEVIETAEGWRAAVYPFATREEAQILNATMVARGWRTRAVTF